MKHFPVLTKYPRIGLFDIEISKQEGTSWQGMYEMNILEITRYSHMMAWSVKDLDGKVETKCLADYKGYKRDKRNDKDLVVDLHRKLSEYDIVVGHNGDKFDIRYSNARFAYHGLTPVPPFKTVDTCKAARQYFNFPSNKLNELAKFFGFKTKVDTGGMALWDMCIAGDLKAWKHMKKYNAYDVVLLEKVYKRMLPFIKNHPNLTHFSGDVRCRSCNSLNIIKRRTKALKTMVIDQVSCKDCGAWMHINQRGKVSV